MFDCVCIQAEKLPATSQRREGQVPVTCIHNKKNWREEYIKRNEIKSMNEKRRRRRSSIPFLCVHTHTAG